MFKIYLLPVVAILMALPIYLRWADASPLVGPWRGHGRSGVRCAARRLSWPRSGSRWWLSRRGGLPRPCGVRGGPAIRGGGSALAVATTAASCTVMAGVSTEVAGGPTASAVAGRCLPSATFGPAVELDRPAQLPWQLPLGCSRRPTRSS